MLSFFSALSASSRGILSSSCTASLLTRSFCAVTLNNISYYVLWGKYTLETIPELRNHERELVVEMGLAMELLPEEVSMGKTRAQDLYP